MTPLISTVLLPIYTRDLKRLRDEIAAYSDEQRIWALDGGIKNTAGNLCLHLVGNLNTFIGAVLGDTGYVRNRDLEFSQKDIPAEKLLQMIDETTAMIGQVLPTISETALEQEFPVMVFETKTSTAYMLIHLAAHLSYHLGQVTYHRRLLNHAPVKA